MSLSFFSNYALTNFRFICIVEMLPVQEQTTKDDAFWKDIALEGPLTLF